MKPVPQIFPEAVIQESLVESEHEKVSAKSHVETSQKPKAKAKRTSKVEKYNVGMQVSSNYKSYKLRGRGGGRSGGGGRGRFGRGR